MTRRATGIDLSSVQNLSSPNRAIDWDKVAAAGFAFAVAKATTGRRDNDEDAFTAVNLRGAESVGLIKGAYHFWIPGVRADLQAANFEAQIAIAGVEPDFWTIDFEWPEPNTWPVRNLDPKGLVAEALELAREMKRRRGRPPVLYTYPWFWTSLPDCDEKRELAAFCPLWIAGGDRRYLDAWLPREDDDTPDVPDDAEQPQLPKPFDRWSFWQYSGGGVVDVNGVKVMKGGKPVPGVGGLCDRNLFNGSVDELRAFCAGDNLGTSETFPATEPAILVGDVKAENTE